MPETRGDMRRRIHVRTPRPAGCASLRNVNLRMLSIVFGAALLCAPRPSSAAAPAASPTPAAPKVERSPLLAPTSVPFIEDDYAAALAEARARKVPLFVEAWAPWCHSCRSMRAFVFTDPALAPLAQRAVWLAVDTEKKVNAPVGKRLEIVALPTFVILDPATERPVARWVGGMNVEQVAQLVEAGGRDLTGDPLDRQLAAADGLHGAGDNEAAASAYATLLAEAPESWGERVRVLESLALALALSGQNEAAAQLAIDHLGEVRRRPAAVTLAATGLDGALELAADHPQRAVWAATLEKSGREIVRDSTLDVSADDRSGLYGSLVSAREAADDEPGRLSMAREWSAFLDRAAAGADTPDQRTVFDSHRLAAYLELGEPERAIPMLLASEHDFPDDYNPPARLALTYSRMRQWDEALAASDRALAKAYGPRRLLILRQRSDILVGRGDREGAKQVLRDALAGAKAMPEGQRSANTIAGLERQLAALDKPPSPGAAGGK
jgi:thioredoxin-like negative regulator of GroEL